MYFTYVLMGIIIPYHTGNFEVIKINVYLELLGAPRARGFELSTLGWLTFFTVETPTFVAPYDKVSEIIKK